MTFYLVDGSTDCFYTAVFDGYSDNQAIISSNSDVQLELGCVIKEVTPQTDKAARVKKKIGEYDGRALGDIDLILRSGESGKEQAALEYIRLIIKHRQPVRTMTNIPAVMEANDMRARVTLEIHKYHGFLRFMENQSGVLYAPYSPVADITDLVAPHFAKRFGNQKFVIHDVKRKIAAMYDGEQIVVCMAGGAEIYLSEYEKTFEELWKLYYKSVNIAERPHEKQMKGYMPVRYWKFMPEKSDGGSFPQ